MSAFAERLLEEPEDASSLRVRRFISGVQLLAGCCYCGNQDVREGGNLVTEYALLLSARGDGAQRALTVSQCCAVLTWLASIEPMDKSECFGHSGNESAVGFHLVLDWVAAELRKAVP
jgi:hypothetical protein